MPINPPPERDEYHASICLSGHVLTSAVELGSTYDQPFCGECGKPAIKQCPSCNALIPGDNTGVIGFKYSPPNHCQSCGAAFPWTEERRQAALELARHLAGSEQEAADLEAGVDALLTEGPRTPLAAAKWRDAIGRHGKNGLDLARDLFVGVVSAAVAKQMGLT